MVNYASEGNFGCVCHGPTVGLVRERKPTKTWERTPLHNLVRRKSGRYYARVFAPGKEVWKSLKTNHFRLAQARLAEFLKMSRTQRRRAKNRLERARLSLYCREPEVNWPSRNFLESLEADVGTL